MEWRFESADQIYASPMRGELMAALHAAGAPDSDFAAAELIYGELISNAIRYARGRVRVELIWQSEFPCLRVHDEEHAHERSFELPADPLAESGRGLYIVNALAKEFCLIRDGAAGSVACATLPIHRRDAAT